ncbi:DUF192 domain-containing protein [Bdellovibrio bacteriovorus]|uniref:DUF192 domain-containing protein n=1 Tax=Bdellovibrio bacteriovorus TaxID=959 RepID=UPI0035A704CC
MASLLKCLKIKTLLFLLTIYMPVSLLAATPFKTRNIKVGTKTLVVEIAETADQHERGLMFREKLGENDGMLFIFKNVETRFFWMKNTLIDLSIGYFDGSGTLVDVQEMKSGKGIPDAQLPSYPSAKPAKYALEMQKGWFEKNKIKIGAKLQLLKP